MKMKQNGEMTCFYKKNYILALFWDDVNMTSSAGPGCGRVTWQLTGQSCGTGSGGRAWTQTGEVTATWASGGGTEVTSRRGHGTDVTGGEVVFGLLSHHLSTLVVLARKAPIMPGGRHVAGVRHGNRPSPRC